MEPVRLRVSYRSPISLLQAFTRSVGKGGVSLPSKKRLERGTRFLFELVAEDVHEPVEVLGEVVEIRAAANGEYVLGIRYLPGRSRRGLDAVLHRLFEAHQTEQVRRYPRVPVHLRAEERSGLVTVWSVRDLSRGGAGVELEAGDLPLKAQVGAPVLIEVWLESGSILLHGEVVWMTAGSARPRTPPALGVSFGRLQPDTLHALDRVLVLDGFPSGPWKAELRFGLDAVERMP
ncbi:MAG TPA: PilZ domain-containing protein [Myxococcaceae bacterium]|nr:PilZ domain-containing protein [Myxococcaceae bacterium]